MSTQTLPNIETDEIISYDPSTGDEIGRVPLMNASDVADAVSWARAAQPAWARLSYRSRAEYILRARERVPMRRGRLRRNGFVSHVWPTMQHAGL